VQGAAPAQYAPQGAGGGGPGGFGGGAYAPQQPPPPPTSQGGYGAGAYGQAQARARPLPAARRSARVPGPPSASQWGLLSQLRMSQAAPCNGAHGERGPGKTARARSAAPYEQACLKRLCRQLRSASEQGLMDTKGAHRVIPRRCRRTPGAPSRRRAAGRRLLRRRPMFRRAPRRRPPWRPSTRRRRARAHRPPRLSAHMSLIGGHHVRHQTAILLNAY